MQTGNEGATGQVAALERLVPELATLQQLLAHKNRAAIRGLQNFANNPVLARLENLRQDQAKELDLLHVLGVQDSELAHSNFLAWLLDPNQNHALGEYFLKSFLFRTCQAATKLGLPAITPARIHGTDWLHTEVRREWQYIDILILNREARFVWAIENKIWADEGIGVDGKSQLTWYRETLKRHFPNFAKHYVFLSPSGMPSQIAEERKYWTPENYATVRGLVDQAVRCKAAVLSTETEVFLRQYVTTLGRKIVPESNAVDQLARKIYLEHRAAIELIYRNKPDYRSDLKRIIKDTLGEQKRWQLDGEDSSWVRFHPIEWNGLPAMWTGTGWSSKAIVLYQFYCTDDNAHFYFTISPGDDELIRDEIIESVRRHPETFNRAGISKNPSWMSVHAHESILYDGDLDNWDDVDAPGPTKLKSWLNNFAENLFPAMNEVIVNCLREYEAEQQNQ